MDIALDREPNSDQLEMFPERNVAAEFLEAIWIHRKEIRRMHEIMEKVLAGEAGYAAHPEKKRDKAE